MQERRGGAGKGGGSGGTKGTFCCALQRPTEVPSELLQAPLHPHPQPTRANPLRLVALQNPLRQSRHRGKGGGGCGRCRRARDRQRDANRSYQLRREYKNREQFQQTPSVLAWRGTPHTCNTTCQGCSEQVVGTTGRGCGVRGGGGCCGRQKLHRHITPPPHPSPPARRPARGRRAPRPGRGSPPRGRRRRRSRRPPASSSCTSPPPR